MSLPVLELPVNAILRIPWRRARASPQVWPNPDTTLKTPGGNPASFANRARRRKVRGAFSEDFTTRVFPATSASPTLKQIIIKGTLKELTISFRELAYAWSTYFHGRIAAVTPYGCLSEKFSWSSKSSEVTPWISMALST